MDLKIYRCGIQSFCLVYIWSPFVLAARQDLLSEDNAKSVNEIQELRYDKSVLSEGSNNRIFGEDKVSLFLMTNE